MFTLLSWQPGPTQTTLLTFSSSVNALGQKPTEHMQTLCHRCDLVSPEAASASNSFPQRLPSSSSSSSSWSGGRRGGASGSVWLMWSCSTSPLDRGPPKQWCNTQQTYVTDLCWLISHSETQKVETPGTVSHQACTAIQRVHTHTHTEEASRFVQSHRNHTAQLLVFGWLIKQRITRANISKSGA